ncbi:hypothetical protein O3P69_004949 [Scylla paramamosain]|uniref:Ionotropic glutamate receptor C-terminal domain-containing protein n=1 Tax=Scylla paramamosain TaxID=85552 RepID=A0AAW0U955_SCYPA
MNWLQIVSQMSHSVEGRRFRMGEAALSVAAALLGQNVSSMKFLIDTPSRVFLGSWVIFSLIVSTAYTGNLIASLALPKSPERPETLEHLINAVNRITMPSYGSAYLDFLKSSDSESFRAWGEMMDVGVSVMDGLQQATEQRFLQIRRFLQFNK